ncbi:MAG: GNAT family N-acetyltransferase [Planctomycetota bacterium]|jgi:GNAT superfamily N-acetyltransferase
MLKFEPIPKYEKGVVFSLLSQSFVELWNDELEEKIKQFDREVFENPDTVGACAFISTLNGNPIGMASWDPRQGPEFGIIGYNCILPEYQGRGFGKTQIKEILKRLQYQRFKKVIVTTGEHPFFDPADKMYLACGFIEIRRYNEGRDTRYGSIDYEIKLDIK